MFPKIDITNALLVTPRLILRPWQESDLNDFYTYASEPGTGEMAGWPHHENIETSREILNMFLEEKNVFALEHRETGKVIGSLGLHDSWANRDRAYEHLPCMEIGYVLSRVYWGQGLMPEAVNAVIRYAFEEMNVALLTVGHFPHNAQSRRVIEKSGFTYVSTGVYHSHSLGKDFDELRYLLKNPKFV